MRLAHLSDIHVPLVPDRGWQRRWDDVASRVREHNPQVIVITGDVIDSATPGWLAGRRLKHFFQSVLPNSFRDLPILLVPGNHDVKAVQGLGAWSKKAAAQFSDIAGWQGGWQPLLDGAVHIFSVDSNNDPWLARGRISPEDLDAARIPTDCEDATHLHIFAMHHHVMSEPRREGEPSLTTDERSLALADPTHLLSRLAGYGFDLVLHGHRHLSTFHAYADPRAERRWRACWLVGAPSATKRAWQGFNFVDIHTDGTFEVHAVRQSQGAWVDPQLVASRDYEETRSRRWKKEIERPEPHCDLLEVTLRPYRKGSDEEQQAQDLAGDISVDVVMHSPENLSTTIEFPLKHVVNYHGAALRDVTASWIDAGGRDHKLRVRSDGTIDVSVLQQARNIAFTAVVLNAIPSRSGDWQRMLASQGDALLDPISVRVVYPARFLRVRLALPGMEFLQPIARATGAREPVTHESKFLSMHTDDESVECDEDILVFRPMSLLSYCFTSGGADPILGAVHISTPPRAARLQETIAQLELATAPIKRNVQAALDRLRAAVIAILRPNLRAGRLKKFDDLSVDLMSLVASGDLSGGIRVVLTDSTTQARADAGLVTTPVGVTFPWGMGVVGRALRQGEWLTWEQEKHNRHSSTWPAEDWYATTPGIGPHAFIYCGPLYFVDTDTRIAVAMLSFSTDNPNSLLGELIRRLRSEPGDGPIAKKFEAGIAQFTKELGAELAPLADDADESDGVTDGE